MCIRRNISITIMLITIVMKIFIKEHSKIMYIEKIIIIRSFRGKILEIKENIHQIVI